MHEFEFKFNKKITSHFLPDNQKVTRKTKFMIGTEFHVSTLSTMTNYDFYFLSS